MSGRGPPEISALGWDDAGRLSPIERRARANRAKRLRSVSCQGEDGCEETLRPFSCRGCSDKWRGRKSVARCYSSRCSAIHDPYCSDYVWSERTEKVAKRGKRRGWQYVMKSVMQRVGSRDSEAEKRRWARHVPSVRARGRCNFVITQRSPASSTLAKAGGFTQV